MESGYIGQVECTAFPWTGHEWKEVDGIEYCSCGKNRIKTMSTKQATDLTDLQSLKDIVAQAKKMGYDVVGRNYFEPYKGTGQKCDCMWGSQMHGVTCPEHSTDGTLVSVLEGGIVDAKAERAARRIGEFDLSIIGEPFVRCVKEVIMEEFDD